jgi:demethylmenaquinone methyltransferase/2-methoxy-6-polyprenyl-1,4-benzoquinol methylase
MADLSGKEKADYIQRMFARLAGRYDLANRLMTWGQDMRWRRQVIEIARLPPAGRLLDVGTGTGGLARVALQRDEHLLAVGADFTPEMMQVGRSQASGKLICWLNSDALILPFEAETFDAVVSGYLLRNVTDMELALNEQYRVLKTGGRVVCLDSSPPPQDIWHFPERLYLQLFIPIIGGVISGDFKAYRYLPRSSLHFLPADQLAAIMEKVGFKDVRYRRFMGGTMAIHNGSR